MTIVEEGSVNVYADLGTPNADTMLVKAQLVSQIEQIIQARKWTQKQAAKALGLTQPKLSNILRGQFRGISETKLLDCLTRLGCDIDIVISSTSKSNSPGRVSVVET